ncbi:MAG: hypothetical protein EHM72_09745 [Calditrichaeota bacterium]|nr:MAG: hypothetical protein EHM72_09745 [Calditrichota bacterium]
MAKAVIIYHSKTGITKRYAKEIENYLKTKGLETHLASIQDYQPQMQAGAQYVLLGCWTSGLMVVLQHPDKLWKRFAAGLPAMPEARIALFTTYKLLTGSMFNNMRRLLEGKFTPPFLELKSRRGELSMSDKAALDAFIA